MEEYAAMVEAQEDREITVIASSSPYDLCAKVEISLFGISELCVSGDSFTEDPEAEWKSIFVYMRHALGLCQWPGKMVLVFDDVGNDVDEDVVNAAFYSLTEEQRTINLGAIALAFHREERAAARQVERLERLAEFGRAQQRHEGEQITLYEALERQEKGTEQLRRMAGEKAKEDPET
jgi:hypothetical protein